MVAPNCDHYIDTAALFKGMRLGMSPESGEDQASYANGGLSIPVKGLKYSVATCLDQLGVDGDSLKLHDAANDAYLTHLILQARRDRMC